MVTEIDNNRINYAKKFFFNLHDNVCNQKYDRNLPYSFHLIMVEKQAEKFKHLILTKSSNYVNIWIAIYGHDSIEDARITYNNIALKFNNEVADIIYLCTEDKGKTREQRKSRKFYDELYKNEDAVFVKLCDIIANSLFSILTNSSMLDKYRNEYKEKVKPILYTDKYKIMFDYLDKIYTL